MSYRLHRTKFVNVLMTGAYVATVALASLALPAATSSAQTASLPEPTPPASTPVFQCDWMGEVHYKTAVTYQAQSSGITTNWRSNDEFNAVTAQLPGISCGALWNGSRSVEHSSQHATSCSYNWTNTQQASGSGTALIRMNLSYTSTEPIYLAVWLESMTGGTNRYITDNATPGCGTDSDTTLDWSPPSVSVVDCYRDPNYTVTGLTIGNNTQATVGSCTQNTTTTSADSTLTYKSEISWRFKKVNCNNLTDSDAGGASDCAEYDARTNPMDAADDARDETAPTITLNTPLNNGSVVLGSSVNASYSCQDETDGSGIASCTSSVANGSSLDTSTVGTKTFTITATDNAGNTTTSAATYTVVYQNTGFLGPVDANMVNKTKAGQTVPVQFRLVDANGTPIDTPSSFVRLTSVGASCSASDTLDAIETYTGGSGLQYLGDGYWQYNWKTAKSYAGQCRVVYLELADGTKASAKFQF